MVDANRAVGNGSRKDVEFDEFDFESEVGSGAKHHAARGAEEREAQARPMEWKPSSLVPSPDPRDGYEFRYIRASARGVPDTINVSSALRDGWVLCDASDFPELYVIPDPRSMYPGKVEFGDLLLGIRPNYIGEQIREHANKEMQAQMDGLENNYFKDQHRGSGMTKVRFGE